MANKSNRNININRYECDLRAGSIILSIPWVLFMLASAATLLATVFFPPVALSVGFFTFGAALYGSAATLEDWKVHAKKLSNYLYEKKYGRQEIERPKEKETEKKPGIYSKLIEVLSGLPIHSLKDSVEKYRKTVGDVILSKVQAKESKEEVENQKMQKAKEKYEREIKLGVPVHWNRYVVKMFAEDKAKEKQDTTFLEKERENKQSTDLSLSQETKHTKGAHK